MTVMNYSSVNNYYYMNYYFFYSLDLKEIKGISRWDISSLIYATQMINGCPGSLGDQSNLLRI